MTLVATKTIIDAARSEHRGVGAFNVLHIETAEALVAAGEASGQPVILQLSENAVRYHGALAPIASAVRAIAEASSATFALHLDHAESVELAREAVSLGFGSIMIDQSHLGYDDNARVTREFVEEAHASGVSVEGEIGEIGGKDGAHAFGVRTPSADAARFWDDTQVDALAVAVGSSHAMTERSARLDLELITEIAGVVAVPLVLHGSSGVPDDEIQAGIRAGMTKINVSTQLNKVFTAAVRAALDAAPQLVDSRKYLGAGREALALEAERLLGVFASAGR